ncbi:MAG: hypothetical protein ABI824_10810 [Acidobacteriota bacterium]
MKRNITLLGLTMLALSVANAASRYKIVLTAPVTVGATHLEAGEYKVEMKGETAVFTRGKTVIGIPAAMETASSKFADNAVASSGATLKEIQLGGTNTKIVMKPAASMSAVTATGQ